MLHCTVEVRFRLLLPCVRTLEFGTSRMHYRMALWESSKNSFWICIWVTKLWEVLNNILVNIKCVSYILKTVPLPHYVLKCHNHSLAVRDVKIIAVTISFSRQKLISGSSVVQGIHPCLPSFNFVPFHHHYRECNV